MRLALYCPEIPQNTGTLLRLGACVGVSVDIIEPCGFVISDRRLQRAGMDYIERSNYHLYSSWQAFTQAALDQRLVLITTSATQAYTDFHFGETDCLIVGQESCGFPQEIESSISHQVMIPMAPGRRSLNVAIAAAMVLGEALRQTQKYHSLTEHIS